MAKLLPQNTVKTMFTEYTNTLKYFAYQTRPVDLFICNFVFNVIH